MYQLAITAVNIIGESPLSVIVYYPTADKPCSPQSLALSSATL